MKQMIKLLSLGIIFLLGTNACSDEDDEVTERDIEGGPLYAIDVAFINPDGFQSYLGTVSTLDDPSTPFPDLSELPEFNGTARVFGPEGEGVAYLTADEEATITEVTFSEDGTPELKRVVSFAGEGLSYTSGGNVLAFFSPTKAYFVSQETLEIVVWNPESMEITNTFPLPLSITPGSFRLFLRGEPIIVGDQLVLISYEWTDGDRFNSNGVTVTVVNTTSDAVISNTVESRAVSFFNYAKDNDGNLYFIPDSDASWQHFLIPDQVQAPVMLRMLAGETSFDPNWSRSFTEEIGTQLWSETLQGPDGSVYFTALDDDLPELQGIDNTDAFYEMEEFKWYKINGFDAEAELTEIVTGHAGGIPFTSEGESYIQRWNADNDTYTLMKTSAAETVQEGLTTPGWSYTLLKVR